MKLSSAVLLATVASASAFAPQPAFRVSNTALNMEKGAGGMFDTRNPDAMEHEDPRKSISAAPSFEEYLKQRDGAAAAPAAEAPAAAAPAAAAPAPAGGFQYGKYDDKLWDNEAKKDVYAAWDPASPRSTLNFNPFETFEGNSPDASGIYPGENRYKDPIRPDMNFAQMTLEREEMEERAANPKPGNTPGCPGCKN